MKSAALPGSSDPMSDRPSTAAEPRVAMRMAWRAVISGPPSIEGAAANRESSIAWRTSPSMWLPSLLADPVNTEADPDTGAEIPTDRSNAGGKPHVRRRTMGYPCLGRRQARDLIVTDEDPVCVPDVGPDPPEVLHVLDGTSTEGLDAEVLLIDGLGDVGVEVDTELSGQRC